LPVWRDTSGEKEGGRKGRQAKKEQKGPKTEKKKMIIRATVCKNTNKKRGE